MLKDIKENWFMLLFIIMVLASWFSATFQVPVWAKIISWSITGIMTIIIWLTPSDLEGLY